MGTDDLHKKSTIKRPQRNLEPKKVILIVCEGEKTEINYFKTLKYFLGFTNVHIKSSPHSSPTKIVEYAIQQVEYTNEYDEIYCVFDRDIHGDFDEALKLADNNHFEVIFSDPCFEFWILLHFTQTAQNFSTNAKPCQAVQKHKDFKKNLPHYSKDYDFEDIINKHLATAIKNANAINKTNLSARQTPYTQVVTLVERLQKLSKIK